MAVQVPRLKRGLFGYRPKIVRTILTGREIMFARVWQRLQRTEAERDGARADLEVVRRDLRTQEERARAAEEQGYRHAQGAAEAIAETDELRALNEALQARIYRIDAEAAEAAAARGGAVSPQDLWESLERAERSITEVIERGRREHEEQLRAIQLARQELQAETDRLEAWRAEMERVLPPATEALGRLAAAARRLPVEVDAAPAVAVHIPEAVSSNGSASREDLAAIQELYGSS